MSFASIFRVRRPAAMPPRLDSRRMVIAVVALFAVTSLVTIATPADTLAWTSGSFSSSSESDLISLTNKARANAGLKALKVDATLTSVARWRSKDMITRDYFSHSIPGYGKVWDKLDAIGYCYTSPARTSAGTPTRRPRDRRDPADVHELARSPRQHPGQDLGQHRHRRLQGRERQEDVDRPLRRQGRVRHSTEAHAEADPQAHTEADAAPDGPAVPRPSPRRARRKDRPTARPTDKPKSQPTKRRSSADANPHADPDPRADTAHRSPGADHRPDRHDRRAV